MLRSMACRPIIVLISMTRQRRLLAYISAKHCRFASSARLTYSSVSIAVPFRCGGVRGIARSEKPFPGRGPAQPWFRLGPRQSEANFSHSRYDRKEHIRTEQSRRDVGYYHIQGFLPHFQKQLFLLCFQVFFESSTLAHRMDSAVWPGLRNDSEQLRASEVVRKRLEVRCGRHANSGFCDASDTSAPAKSATRTTRLQACLPSWRGTLWCARCWVSDARLLLISSTASSRRSAPNRRPKW